VKICRFAILSAGVLLVAAGAPLYRASSDGSLRPATWLVGHFFYASALAAHVEERTSRSFAGSRVSFQPTQPTSRRYLTDEQWASIEKMPEMDASKLVVADDIDKLLSQGKVVFLDVREPQEVHDLGTVRGHVNIPFLQLEQRLSEIPKDSVVLTACNTGTGRAPRAAEILRTHGYRVIGFCGLRDYKGKRIHPPVRQ
jgi:rhodanese-related sulfurtransferase